MKAYLIDPETRGIMRIELPDGPDGAMLAEMRLIIGGDMDHALIDDMRDSIWVHEFGLKNGVPIHAFKLPVQRDPFAGRAIVIGADDRGFSRPPYIPIELLFDDIEWLGVIVPSVDWIETETGARAVVTYSRPK